MTMISLRWLLSLIPLVCLALMMPILLGTAAAAEAEEIVRDGEVKTLRFEPADMAREGRVVPVKVYLPPAQAEAANAAHPDKDTNWPVVLFSHGLGGSRENGVYLGEHWARAGYACVFMQHAGSDEAVWKDASRADRMAALKEAANLQAMLDRFADVPFVQDTLERWNAEDGHALHGLLDLERVGMAGHSFGAVTTQGMMGQTFPLGRSFAEPRIDAFLPMSPSISKGLAPARSFGEIESPVLCMTGTKDDSPIDPTSTPESRREVYAALPAGKDGDPDKYQLVFEGAHHFAFSDRAVVPEGRFEHHHPAILEISTKFWDTYLKDDAAAKAWLRDEKRVREDAGLKAGDVWELK